MIKSDVYRDRLVTPEMTSFRGRLAGCGVNTLTCFLSDTLLIRLVISQTITVWLMSYLKMSLVRLRMYSSVLQLPLSNLAFWSYLARLAFGRPAGGEGPSVSQVVTTFDRLPRQLAKLQPYICLGCDKVCKANKVINFQLYHFPLGVSSFIKE